MKVGVKKNGLDRKERKEKIHSTSSSSSRSIVVVHQRLA
jgi:hypothetical protein